MITALYPTCPSMSIGPKVNGASPKCDNPTAVLRIDVDKDGQLILIRNP
jgi:hypothetical protein